MVTLSPIIDLKVEFSMNKDLHTEVKQPTKVVQPTKVDHIMWLVLNNMFNIKLHHHNISSHNMSAAQTLVMSRSSEMNQELSEMKPQLQLTTLLFNLKLLDKATFLKVNPSVKAFNIIRLLLNITFPMFMLPQQIPLKA